MRQCIFIFFTAALLVSGCAAQKPLLISPSVAVIAESETYKLYIVQPGDSAGKIAAQFHMTIGKLSVLNPGVALSPLKIGQKLYVVAPTNN
jgi:LysM repeat protein